MGNIQGSSLAHIHVMVDDIDDASAFYREVMGFLEMQSHRISGNAGLAAYYGIPEQYGDFAVQLRFLTWPGAVTIKLVQLDSVGGVTPTLGKVEKGRGTYSGYMAGLGALSIELDDIDATFAELNEAAKNYSSKWRFELLSEPVFLSPLKPHEIGTTEHSVLHGRKDTLSRLEKRFAERAKFQLVDPFGVRWEFNNSTI